MQESGGDDENNENQRNVQSHDNDDDGKGENQRSGDRENRKSGDRGGGMTTMIINSSVQSFA